MDCEPPHKPSQHQTARLPSMSRLVFQNNEGRIRLDVSQNDGLGSSAETMNSILFSLMFELKGVIISEQNVGKLRRHGIELHP